MNDLILIESQSARTEALSGVTDDRATHSLNKAKALTMALWEGRGIATTKQMAEYYEVSEDTVQTFVKTNRDELLSDGLKTIKGKELRDVVSILNTTSDKTPSLTIWTPRAALRLGMLLRDSLVAKAVRSVLLDIAEAQPHIANNSIYLEIENRKLHIEQLKLEIEALKIEKGIIAPARPQKFKVIDLTGIENIESVEAYIRDRIKLNPSGKVYVGKATGNTSTHLYPNYLEYCNQHDFNVVTVQRFSRVLMQLVYATMQAKLGKGKDRVGCHVKGVEIAA